VALSEEGTEEEEEEETMVHVNARSKALVNLPRLRFTVHAAPPTRFAGELSQ